MVLSWMVGALLVICLYCLLMWVMERLSIRMRDGHSWTLATRNNADATEPHEHLCGHIVQPGWYHECRKPLPYGPIESVNRRVK